MNAYNLETARLLLRPCVPSDVDALHALWIDPHVRKYLWDDRIIERDVAAEIIEGSLVTFETNGFGQWVVLPKDQDSIAGFCGLRFVHDTNDVELLYGFYPAFCGKGLATEAAIAILRHGFETAGLENIFADTDLPNEDSVKLLKRIGMSSHGEFIRQGLPTAHFSVTRQQFREAHGKQTPA